MCGITGWVDFKKQLVQEKQTMDRMTDTLSKRGPDDSNVWGSTMFYSDIKDLRLLILKADASRWRVPIKAIRTPLFTMASFITRKICAKNCGRGAINSKAYVRYRGASAQLHRVAGRLCRPSQWHIRFRCVG